MFSRATQSESLWKVGVKTETKDHTKQPVCLFSQLASSETLKLPLNWTLAEGTGLKG